MDYQNDPYRDENGEPLMDFEEEFQSDEDNDWRRRGRSPSPVFLESDTKSKPRKRLVRKSDVSDSVPYSGIRNYDEYGVTSSGEGKRKMLELKDKGIEKKWKVDWRENTLGGDKSGSKFKMKKSREQNSDMEAKEMWDTIAGGHSEGEADDDITNLFKRGKKKKRCERSAAEIALLVEKVMAELEFSAEEDQLLNIESKPAINKLKKLPLLTEALSKKQLQEEFLDHGILSVLKNWLEPLPDGSFPNINIRTAILKILTDFPINLEQYDRKEQLKKSGLGKVIMFLSKSEEETPSNRKIAKELVNNWSRPIFNKSTRFEDMRHYDGDRVPFKDVSGRSSAVFGSVNKTAVMHSSSRDDDLDLAKFSRESKAGLCSSRQHALRPEAMPLDFVVRPRSKIDHNLLRARGKQVVQDQRRLKMNKKLQDLKGPKKKQLQASKISVEGRGMVKYL